MAGDRQLTGAARQQCSRTPHLVRSFVAAFARDAHAEVINVIYTQPDQAVVQVGFPGNGPYYWLNIFRHHDGGWRTERP